MSSNTNIFLTFIISLVVALVVGIGGFFLYALFDEDTEFLQTSSGGGELVFEEDFDTQTLTLEQALITQPTTDGFRDFISATVGFESLVSNQTYTIFVPSNDAMQNASESINSLMSTNNTEMIQNILRSHTLDFTVQDDLLTDGIFLDNVNGELLSISSVPANDEEGGTIKILDDFSTRRYQLLTSGIPFDGGIFYIIDGIIEPDDIEIIKENPEGLEL